VLRVVAITVALNKLVSSIPDGLVLDVFTDCRGFCYRCAALPQLIDTSQRHLHSKQVEHLLN